MIYPETYPEGTIFRERKRGLELQVRDGALIVTQLAGSKKNYYSIKMPLGKPDNWEIITKESYFDKIYLTLKDGLS